MAEQLRLPFPERRQGVSFLRHGARRYAHQRGATYDPTGLDEVQAAPAFQHAVGREYENAPVVPNGRIAAAYRALTAETESQYDYLTRPRTAGGLGMQVEFHDDDPYPDPASLMEDIQQNRRLKVMKSSTTGGAPHQFLDEQTNDKFRAVHDAFGHAAIGRSFTRHGEEAAFLSHAQMYSPSALPALTAETRAQNSAMNFGLNRQPGTFVEQKPVMLPEWAQGRNRELPEPPVRRTLQGRQFKLPFA